MSHQICSSNKEDPMNDSEIGRAVHAYPTQEWIVLPRPKKGRKTIRDDLSTKRSVNRESQRAFRKRKNEYVQSLEDRLRDCEKGQVEKFADVQKAARKVQKENADLVQKLKEIERSFQEYRTSQREHDAFKCNLKECRKEKQALEERISILTQELKSNGLKPKVAIEKDVRLLPRPWRIPPKASYPELAYFVARPIKPSLPIPQLLNDEGAKLCNLCTHTHRCLCSEIADEIRFADVDGITSSTTIYSTPKEVELVTCKEPNGSSVSHATRLGILSKKQSSIDLSGGLHIPQHDPYDFTAMTHVTDTTKKDDFAINSNSSKQDHPASQQISKTSWSTYASSVCPSSSARSRSLAEETLAEVGLADWRPLNNPSIGTPVPLDLVARESFLQNDNTVTVSRAVLCCGDRQLCSGMGVVCTEQMEPKPTEFIHPQIVAESQMRDSEMNLGDEQSRQHAWPPLRALMEIITNRFQRID